MKIGVIGAGNWGNNLIYCLQELGVLHSVAETRPEILAEVATNIPDLILFDNHDPMLKSVTDAVVIATPVDTHYEVTKRALQAGKDVLVEKPISLSTAEAEELVKLAEAEGQILMVGHLLLFQPAIQWIKSYLDSGQLGTIYSLHQQRLNLGTVRSVENALWSLGVHDVAVLLYLAGQIPDRVRVIGQSVLQEGIEDDVYMHMEFPNGEHAHIHSSWLWPELTRRLIIIGSDAMLSYSEPDQTVKLHSRSIGSDLTCNNDGDEIIFSGNGNPLKLELESFISAIESRETPLSDGASAVEVVRVLEEATKQLEVSIH